MYFFIYGSMNSNTIIYEKVFVEIHSVKGGKKMRQTNRYCIFDFFGDSYYTYDILRALGMRVVEVDDDDFDFETPYVYDEFDDIVPIKLRDVYDVIKLFGEKAAVYSCEEIDWDEFVCENIITYDNYSFE